MKRYDNVIKRVRAVEEKYGINYAKTDGTVYKTLAIFGFISGIYYILMSLMFILSVALMISSGNADWGAVRNAFITIVFCTAVFILGAVLYFVRFKIVGNIVVLASLPFAFFSFMSRMHVTDFSGLWGLNAAFYWRHGIPAVLLAVFLISMLVIAIRERLYTDKMYKKITENIYNTYKSTTLEELTDEQWEEQLKNYKF